MSIESLEIRQGDTAQPLDGTLTGENRAAQSLVGCTVTVSLRRVATGALVIDARPCAIVDAVAGKVSCALLPADVATPGAYYFWFVVTLADGSTLRFPTVASLGLTILPAAPTAYFDAGVPAHLQLLPPSLREHEDLAAIAFSAEADVLTTYLRVDPDPDGLAPLIDGMYVYLRGYTGDPLTTNGALAGALRREIANVMRWRAARDAKKPGVTSESAGDPATTKAYDAALEHALPPDFGRVLRPFLIRLTPWAL